MKRLLTMPPPRFSDASAAEEPADAPVRKVKTMKITPVPECAPSTSRSISSAPSMTRAPCAPTPTPRRRRSRLPIRAGSLPRPKALPAGTYVIQIASLPSEAGGANLL